MNSNIDLTGLKGLHYPIAPNWWPLSYGWYIILGIMLLFAFLITYRKRTSPLAYANREMEKIQRTDSEKQLKLLSQLLKRVGMARYGREKIASLSEESWQEFLLASAPQVLTKEQAYQLAYAIYNPAPKAPNKKLFSACQKWIQTLLKRKG